MGTGVLGATERQGSTHRKDCQAGVLGVKKGVLDRETGAYTHKGREAGPATLGSAWSQTTGSKALLCVKVSKSLTSLSLSFFTGATVPPGPTVARTK